MTQALAHKAPRLFTPFRFSAAERKVLQRKEPLTVSQWAEKYRIVPIGAHVGPWRNAISPHLTHIMDTWAEPHVREVIICKSPQTGGTESMYNCAAYVMDRDPSIQLFIMPSEADARKVATDRIIPMIMNSPRLAELSTGNPDDIASRRIRLQNGSIAYMAWSNSPSALATFPVKYLFFDEIDKYPPFVGKETDPITLGEKRARTYRYTHKIFKVSTPTREDGPIWRAYNGADVQYKRQLPCPYCGHWQELTFGNLTWPDDTPPEQIKRESLARYQCAHCTAQWTDADRDIALHRGRWVAEKGAHIQRPRVVAYHLPSFISPDVSLSEIAAVYLLSKHNRAKLIDFYNDYLAQPFTDDLEGETMHEDILYARRHRYAPEGAEWQIPAAAYVLTAFVDVQANRLEAEVVAWGAGYESWGIEYRIFPGDPSSEHVWNDLDEYLNRQWTHESGLTMRLSAVGIDSGYKAPEVYRFVRQRQSRRIYACKGSSTAGKPLLSVPSIGHLRKTKAQRNRVTPINIGTEAAKNTLYAWMQIEQPGPGYMHFPEDYGYDWFRMLTAEKAVIHYDKAGHPRRVWVKKTPSARNEALDIRCGNYAMIELLVPNWPRLAAHFSQKIAAAQQHKNEQPGTNQQDQALLDLAPKPKQSFVRKAMSSRRGGWVGRW